MRILLSSYSFGAGRGSEAGVGWNVAKGMAQRGHEVTVLTTSEFHDINVKGIAESGLSIRLAEWDGGLKPQDFPLSKSYQRWQVGVGKFLRELCRKEGFDLIHHVTFNQYRRLHDVFAADLPYVIGPVGGAETVAPCLLKDLPWKLRLKETARKTSVDALPLARRVRRHKQRGIVLASTPGTCARLEYVGISSVVLNPIIAIAQEEIVETPPTVAEDPFFVFYGGGARPEKGTLLLIRAMAALWNRGTHVPVHLVAVAESLRPDLLRYAAAQGLPEEALVFVPFMPRPELMALMRRSRAFLALNFRDDGCMALLEAVALGIPSVCLDIPSQFWLPQEYADKVPIHPGMVEADLADALRGALEAPAREPAWHARRVEWLRSTMSWEARLDQLEKYYRQLLS